MSLVGALGYYQRWVRALERLALDHSLITPTELDARTEALATEDSESDHH